MPSKVPKTKDSLAAYAAQLHYCAVPPKSQNEIAEILRVDKATVSRLIKHAKDSHMLAFSVVLPRELTLEGQLTRLFGLVDAYVVPIVPPKGASGKEVFQRLLGQAAAQYIESSDSLIKPGYRIGIGGGATLRNLVLALTHERFSGLNISQLTVETHHDAFIDEAPFTLTAILYAKWRKDSYATAAHPLCIPSNSDEDPMAAKKYRGFRESVIGKAEELDTVIIGIGSAEVSSPTGSFARTLKASGVTPSDLKKQRVVGEICNHPYDEDGRDLFDSFAEKNRLLRRYTDGIELGSLQSLVARPARVLAIAGGEDKLRAIRTALRCRLVNHLVTDTSTAEALCEMP